MSNFSKIIDSLSPYAEDVARAASEFGDDAVRSILKATPAMRKRLASLADRQMGVAAKQSKNYASKSSESSVLENVGSSLRDLFDDFDGAPNLGTRGDVVFDSVWMKEQVPYQDYRDWKQTLGEIAFRAKQDAAKPIDAAEALSSLEQQARRWPAGTVTGDIAQKSYNDAVLGLATRGELPNRLVEARNRGDALSRIFSNTQEDDIYANGPGNIVPAINQARLSALLRMIGDAQ
jgi:hypothetical protein